MEYKSVNNNEDIAHYFEDLSINTYDDYIPELTNELLYTGSKQFYIPFCKLKASESVTIINILADNAFKYQVTLSNEIVSLITPAFYIFNLSIDSKYNDTEFKELLINLGASS